MRNIQKSIVFNVKFVYTLYEYNYTKWTESVFIQTWKLAEKNMQKLGQRIAELRKENHYKQTEIANKLNVSQQVISNIERGITTPDVEQLKCLADIFNVSLDWLVDRDFSDENADNYERQIINYIKKMDDKGKELSLGLLSQVAQHRGNSDGNK